MTFTNTCKTFIGITALVTSKFISDCGLYTALVGTILLCMLNMYTMWLLIKARNRFKHHKIATLGDLAVKLYGDNTGYLVGFIQIAASIVFLLAYQAYMGE